MESVQVLKRNKLKAQDKYITHHLTLESSFGCHQTPLLSNCFIVSSSILYLNDSFLILHNIIQSTKKFLYKLAPGEVVTAMSYNHSLEFLIILGISAPSGSYLLLYDGRDATPIRHSLPPHHETRDLYFFSSTEFAALIKSPTESYVLVKRFFRNNTLSFSESKGALKKHVSSEAIKICSECQGMVYLVTPETIITACYEDDNTVDTVTTTLPDLIDCIVYSNDQLISLTKTSLLFYQKNRLVEEIPLAPIAGNDCEASVLLKLTKRLVVGYGNKVCLSVFSFDGMKMKHLQTYSPKERIKGGIVSIHGSFEELNIGITIYVSEKCDTDFNYERGKPLPKDVYLENMVFGLTSISVDKVVSPFSRLFKNEMEYGEVSLVEWSGIPECYVLTQRTLSIYNYSNNFKIREKIPFGELPLSISVHPFGYMMVCTFKDSFRLYYKLQAQLMELKKEPHFCSCASFSSRGLLALSLQNKSHFDVVLYDVTRFQSYRTLSSFVSKFPITKIHWVRQDSQLQIYTSTNEFVLIDILNDTVLAEYTQRKQQKVICYDWVNHLLLSIYPDDTLAVYKLEQNSKELSSCLMQLSLQEESITSVYIDKFTGMLILGMASGQVRWSEWPWAEMTSKEIMKSFGEIAVSNQPVTGLHVSPNSKYVLCVCGGGGGGGVTHMLRIKKRKNGKMLNYELDVEFSGFQHIKLSSIDVLSGVREKIKYLQEKQLFHTNELQELEPFWQLKEKQELQKMEQECKGRELSQQSAVMQGVAQNRRTKHELDRNFEKLHEARRSMEEKASEDHEKQMVFIYAEMKRLEAYKLQIQEKIQGEHQEASRFYQDTLDSLTQDFDSRMATTRQGLITLKDRIQQHNFVKAVHQQQDKQQEEEHLNRIIDLVHKEEQQLTTLVTEAKSRISNLRRDSQNYNIRADFLEGKRKNLQLQVDHEQSQYQQLGHIKQQLQKTFEKVEKTTLSNEQELKGITLRNLHLFNFRSVYTHLESNLNIEISTLQEYNGQLSSSIKKMNSELIHMLGDTTGLSSLVQAHRNSILAKRRTLSSHEKPRIVISSLCNDVCRQFEMMASQTAKQDPTLILQSLNHKIEYINKMAKESLPETLSSEALLRPREDQKLQSIKNHLSDKKQYFQNFVDSFKYQHKALHHSLSSAFLKLQNSNSKLIAECNGLKQQLQKKEKTINELYTTLRTIDCMNADICRESYHVYEHLDVERINTDNEVAERFLVRDRKIKTAQSHSRSKMRVTVKHGEQDNFSARKKTSVRRIMTATQNGRYLKAVETTEKYEVESTVPSKPPTSQGLRRQKFSNPSHSKGIERRSSATGLSLFDERTKHF